MSMRETRPRATPSVLESHRNLEDECVSRIDGILARLQAFDVLPCRSIACQVYSAASDGSEESYSCRLWAYPGTSMSCPIVVGASAMVRLSEPFGDAFSEAGAVKGFSHAAPFLPITESKNPWSFLEQQSAG